MNLQKRLARLEGAGHRMEPVFLPVKEPIADSLDYVGVVGGLRFDREENESREEFKNRCLAYDQKHRDKGQMPIFFDIRL